MTGPLISFYENIVKKLKDKDVNPTELFLLNEFMMRYNREHISDEGKELLEFIEIGYRMYKTFLE